MENGKWGLIDRAGRLATGPLYDAMRPFKEGLAAARIGNKYGFIDRTAVPGGSAVQPRTGSS